MGFIISAPVVAVRGPANTNARLSKWMMHLRDHELTLQLGD